MRRLQRRTDKNLRGEAPDEEDEATKKEREKQRKYFEEKRKEAEPVIGACCTCLRNGLNNAGAADAALAFASNSYGDQCVSIETSISHTKAVKEGDVLTAIAKEANRTNKIAIYEISVFNQDNETVAIFRGNVYNTGKEWFPKG